MYLKRLVIHNYRSIRHLELHCGSLVILIGPNNHGKSNILSALEFGLSTASKPTRDDFFFFSDDTECWVEMTFTELTPQERTTFKRYVRADGTICVRKTCAWIDGQLDIRYNGYIEQPSERWLQPDNVSEYTSREAISATPLRDLVPRSGRLTKQDIEEAQQRFIALHRHNLTFKNVLERGPFLGRPNVGGGVLPDFYLIPAVRDLTDEIKIKNTTAFGRLLSRAIKEMAERDPRIQEVRQGLEQVVSSLNMRDLNDLDQTNMLALLERTLEDELRAWDVQIKIEVSPPDIERLFELGTELYVNDGVSTKAQRKGHGLQRAVIFALLRSWAKLLRETSSAKELPVTARRHSESVVFAVEEPELFLHPHAQRKLAKSLRAIANTPQHQVFICTHSTHFVDLNHYREISIVRRDSPKTGTEALQCTTDLFAGPDVADRKKRLHMAQWINPDRAEMFFARRAVFVEGETERVVLPFLADRLGIFDPDVSIIDCGSKFNLPLYIEIANAFSIPYLVIHDEDPLPDPVPSGWSEDKLAAAKRTFALNSEIASLVQKSLGDIEVFSPDFENAAGVSKSQADKKGKALAALDHFAAMDDTQIPERLLEVVRAAYAKNVTPCP